MLQTLNTTVQAFASLISSPKPVCYFLELGQMLPAFARQTAALFKLPAARLQAASSTATAMSTEQKVQRKRRKKKSAGAEIVDGAT